MLSRWTELIRRTLPESISIRRVEDAEAGSSEIDANQLESALLNLAVNARDAMPNGGTLTIETSRTIVRQHDFNAPLELKPGDYVLICVSDTGVGMTKEVLDRAFEPFFTTKPLGQGTGLGLSQVFGFVKQSGGNVKMYSHPGQGTTVKVYLPRIGDAGAAQDSNLIETPAANGKRSESILVVEDNEDVRAFAVEALRDYGFSVLEASDAAEALRTLDRQANDRPAVHGHWVARSEWQGAGRHGAAEAPEHSDSFTSGYAQMPSPTSSRWMSEIPLLSKPFTRSQLYDKVLLALGAG